MNIKKNRLMLLSLFTTLMSVSTVTQAGLMLQTETWRFSGSELETGMPTGNITTKPKANPSNPTYDVLSDKGRAVTVQAFRLQDGDSKFEWSRVSRNQNKGLGVSRANKVIGGNGTIDNLGSAVDLLLFDFGANSDWLSWTIDFTSNTANDNALIYAGNNLLSGSDLFKLNFDTLLSVANFDVIDNSLNTLLHDPFTLTLNSPYQYLLVSAQPSQQNDNFRIGAITASSYIQQVPEPHTNHLIMLGLLMLLLPKCMRQNA